MPELRLVVSNTTPIISLSLLGHLQLLRQLYQHIIVPPAVSREVLAGGAHGVGVVEFKKARWISTRELAFPQQAELLTVDLDRGEAEVLVLAQELKADLVIIDVRLARLHAQHLELPLTGTLGVLLRAKRDNLITDIRPLINALLAGDIHLGDKVVARALKLAGESE